MVISRMVVTAASGMIALGLVLASGTAAFAADSAQIPPGSGGQLSNGVAWTASPALSQPAGVPEKGAAYIVPGQGETFTFSPAANKVEFTIKSLTTVECMELPAGTKFSTLASYHTYNESTRTLCATDDDHNGQSGDPGSRAYLTDVSSMQFGTAGSDTTHIRSVHNIMVAMDVEPAPMIAPAIAGGAALAASVFAAGVVLVMRRRKAAAAA